MMKNTFNNLFSRFLKLNALFTLLLCFLFSFFQVNAQSTGTIQIGSGTNTGSGDTTIPVTNYNYSYSQQIVTAAEYSNGDGIPGQITKIRYYVTNIGTMSVWNNWTVYLGNTTKTSFSSTTDWVSTANLTQVFSGTITATANNWFEITFSQPFDYTGGNLIVAVDENASGWNSPPTFQMYTSTSNSGILYRSDDTNPNPTNPPTATSRQSKLPQLQFVGPLASCLKPTNVNVTSITSTGATISWTASTSLPSGGYSYEVRTDTNPGTAGAIASGSVGAGVLTTPVTGLQADTSYNVYVKSDCGTGNTSAWSIIKTFRTLCNSISTFPWTENFNTITTPNLPGCWSQINVNNDGDFWITYTDYGVSSSKCVGLYTDYNAGNNDDYLVLPRFTLTGNQRMKFSVRARSSTEKNDYRVVLSTTGNIPSNFTTVLKPLTEVSNTVHQEVDWIDLSSYTGDVFIAIHVPQGGADGYYIYFDDFLIQDIPSCLIPGNVQVASITKNTATLSWTAPQTAPAGGYEYEIRTSGAAGSGATGLATQGTTLAGVTTANVTGLIPATAYSVYARSVCAVGNLSAWTLVKNFKTLCDYPDLVSTTPATICGVGTATISADFSNNANINWFAAATGGNSLHTGPSFTTPELNATTSYWVSAASDGAITGSGAKLQPASSATGSTFTNWGIVFNLTQDALLKSTDIYSSTNGTVNIKIVNSAGVEVFATGNVNVTNGGTATPNLIPLNVNLPAGNGYKILVKSYTGANLIRESSGLIFPYLDTNGILTATASEWGGTTTSSYYYFYNLQYEVGCSSPRVEVPVTVTSAPELVLSSEEIDVCQGNDSELITITEGTSDYDTYVWTPSEGVTGDEISGWMINAQSSGVYTLRASQSNGVCKVDIPVQVNVSQVGYTPLEEEYIICKDNILELSVAPSSDSEYIVGTATTKTGTSDAETAFMNRYPNSRQQYVYTQAELNALGFNSGTITGLAFNISSLGSAATNADYTIKMKQVSNASITSTTYVTSDMVTVYGPVTHTHTATGWQIINFTTPFVWDGASNILIELSHKGINSSNNAETYYTLTTDNTGVYYQGSTVNPTAGTLTKKRLNTKFLVERELTTSWEGDHLYLDAAATQSYSGENTQTVYFKHTVEGEYPVSVTISNSAVNCEATTTTTVKIPTIVLPSMNNQVYCEPTAVGDLIFDRIDGYVYTWHSSATSTATISTISTSGTYYLEVTSNEGNCKAARVPVEIIIAQNLEAVVNPSYTFCDQATFADINVGTQYGAGVQWFASADSTTVLDPSTSLTNTTYYVALAINNCVSTRKPVNVTILQTPAPIAAQQAFTVCYNTSLSTLNVGASDTKWYYTQTSTTALGTSAIAQNNTYYVVTYNGICESARIPVVVNVVQQLQMPTASPQSFCVSGTVSQLVATGAVTGAEYVWYASASSTTPLQPSAALQSGTYYVIQKLTGCESPRRAVTVHVTNLTAPQTTSFEFCGNATVADLHMPALSGVTYNWYLPNGTTPLTGTTPLSTGNYYVSKSQNGCESAKTIVQVTMKPRPSSPTGSTTQNFVDSAVLSELVMNQLGVIWYVTYEDAINGVNPLPPNMPLEDGHTYYGVLIGSNGCASLPTAVNVVITLGVKDLDLASLKYYPNPVNSELTVTYKEPIKLIEVYDLLGKQVKVQKFDSTDVRLDVSSLSSGTYMMRVQTDSGSQFIKIIKN